MFILTNSNLFPSARALRNEIANISGERLVITLEYPSLGKVGIRWGNSAFQTNGVTDLNLNSAMLVRLMSNKKLFSDKYRNDFWVPDFRKDTPSSENFPVLIRRTMSGFGGVGIIPCDTYSEFQQSWDGTGYWTKYINLSSEFRVHIFDGEVLRIFKKVRESGIEESKFNIRNADRGWHFSPIEKIDSLMGLRELAKIFWNKTQEFFHLEHGFFALDVGWNKEAKRYFILEGNTAPGIVHNPNTLRLYAERFINVLNL